ncbi:MAG TPA: efflux RND transporter permease subunit [Tenuifilaceae bacterium]|nr:efflux RND transporter permease subunit [Tenuifilaceae bacterium]HPI43734.1 efflux RND transporter permease subunit [Tenuifilaceae bacterium]HPN20511.1 efflux RND transporter permease subunit [Tenuifilaceae bacterium]
MEKKFKEFFVTSWAIDNKISVYVLVFIISVFGIINYLTIPKEQMPEVEIPMIIVNSIYPGTSPVDMENLVTRPLEKNLKSISGVKKITSRSVQDFSAIIVEFNTDVELKDAKQKVNDAVDKTKKDLPTDELFVEPVVAEVELSEIPIMTINLSGDIPLDKLKIYADDMKDRIEGLKEITRVDIVGALDREIQIDVDMYKMRAASLTFRDVEQAVNYDNTTVSGGNIDLQGMSRSIRVVGEFKSIDDVMNIVVNTSSGAQVKLKDIATVKDGFKKVESFARFDGKNVVNLNVVKKSGQNLLDASDQIKEIIDDMSKNNFPSNLKVEITGDQSHYTRNTLNELNNTIIIGFILVTIVLMFFMGLVNALFVALSVPLSMALAYIVLPHMDFTMNMLVMFSFIFALGIVVDDAIVVIENTHRIFKKTNMDIKTSAKFAAGEVFVPILSGTLTTLAPFFPLAFWPGVVGEFMSYIPITLMLTLFASLIVAYFFNPVFAVDFMKHDEGEHPIPRKTLYRILIFMGIGAALLYIAGFFGIANFVVLLGIIIGLHNIYGYKMLRNFQHRFIPAMMRKYENLLKWVLEGKRPVKLMWGMIVLFVVTMILNNIVHTPVVFFPDNEPNTVNTFIKMPVGTDINTTDSVAKIVEKRVIAVLGENNPIVESVVTNVAFSASEDEFDNFTKSSHLAKIAVNFVEHAKRDGQNTSAYLNEMRKAVKDIPGAEIVVDKNQMGPPTGKPINIEISGENLEELISTTNRFKRHIDSLSIDGIEELKSDFATTKPEIIINLDRERANIEGISAGMVGGAIRTALFGSEISKYREGEEQYPIMLRFDESQRNDIEQLLNLPITYRDMNSGILRQIPLSSVAKVDYVNSYGQINRLNLKRVITLSSNVLDGYTANEIIPQIHKAIPNFEKSTSIDIKITGEQEDQQESMLFLMNAMLLALFLIMFILVTQFNSMSKPIIIISEVIFSIIGVLLGYMLFDMTISIIMTGMGIVALAGIVVRNGILLVEFTDVLIAKGMKTRDAIVEAGKTRITPVVLTATATILGLVPLAIGMNINFVTLFTELNPHIHFGGDNVAFFGPLSWTIIFGLSFATFLTLILIPVMYLLIHTRAVRKQRRKSNRIAKKTNFKELY